jgi:hypothetical protein
VLWWWWLCFVSDARAPLLDSDSEQTASWQHSKGFAARRVVFGRRAMADRAADPPLIDAAKRGKYVCCMLCQPELVLLVAPRTPPRPASIALLLQNPEPAFSEHRAIVAKAGLS